MSEYSFHHVHHETDDVDAAVAFYKENFAAEVNDRFQRDGVEWARISIGDAAINVTNRADTSVALNRYRGLDHFALRTNDFDGTIARLRENNVTFFSEPENPSPGVQVVFIAGPDNIKIEILHIA